MANGNNDADDSDHVVPFDPKRAERRVAQAMPPADSPGQRDLVLQAVLAAKIALWRSPAGDVFMTVPDSGSTRRLAVRSLEAARLIRQLHAAAHPKTLDGPKGQLVKQPPIVTDATVKAVQSTLEAMSYGTPVHEPRVRVANHAGARWLDLGDATYETVRITPRGWGRSRHCSAPLIRPPGLLALPRPRRSDTVAGELARRLCVTEPDDFPTLICFLLSALGVPASHPILIVVGDWGAGKTTLCRFLRGLIDPHQAALEALPENERDLAVIASSCHMLAFDNVSSLTPQQADWICRLSTGFVFRVRALNTDRDITCFTWCGPVVLNGIPGLVARSDLASRVFILRLQRPESGYRPERDLGRGLEQLRAGVLAYLLDGVVTALKRIDEPRERLPRLADAAAFCMAAAPAFGWTEEEIAGLFRRKHAEALGEVARNDPVAATLLDWFTKTETRRWPMATLGELHKLLTEHASRTAVYAREWPKLASDFGVGLARVEGALAETGVTIIWSEDRRRLALTMAGAAALALA
jgi:hypothetical protein